MRKKVVWNGVAVFFMAALLAGCAKENPFWKDLEIGRASCRERVSS